MKTARILLAVIIIISAYFTSCKKDSTPQPGIAGKWKLQYVKSKLSTHDGILDSLTINATHGDYVEFRKDGKVYINTWLSTHFNSELKIEAMSSHTLDTIIYKIINDKLIVIKDNISDTITIFQLTNSKLVVGLNVKLIKDDIQIDANNYIIWDTQSYYTK